LKKNRYSGNKIPNINQYWLFKTNCKQIRMKIFIVVAVIAVIAAFIFLTPMLMAVNKTEEQPYTLILKEKDFEIRFYPAATIATIKSNAKSYKELANPGFGKLAGYIFGGNESKTSIAMTSPVHMDINDTVSSMSFVMPSAFNQSNLPKPNDPDVIIKKTEDEYVAVYRFGGYASDEDLKIYSEKLRKILQEKGIKTLSNYRFLGYNPPFQLVGRRNEIIVKVDWKKK
jgi:hypothetical protein